VESQRKRVRDHGPGYFLEGGGIEDHRKKDRVSTFLSFLRRCALRVALGLSALLAIATGSDMELHAPAGYFDLIGSGTGFRVGPSNREALAIFTVGGADIGAAVGGLMGLAAPGWAWKNRWRAPRVASVMALTPMAAGARPG
jgi:hypothetical protein